MNILDDILQELRDLRADVATLLSRSAQQAPPAEEDRFIGTAEAAKLLGHTPKWVREHLGQIPHSKTGPGRKAPLLFSTLELKAWQEQRFENGRQSTTDEAAAQAMAGKRANGTQTPARAGARMKRIRADKPRSHQRRSALPKGSATSAFHP